MNKSGGRLLAAAMVFAAAGTAQAQVVISQVYSGGGDAGARFKSDYVELHNNGDTTVNLSGWTVQYAHATLPDYWETVVLTGSIAPGGYYLLQQAPGAGGIDPNLPPADQTGDLHMQTSMGRVMLKYQDRDIDTSLTCHPIRVDRFAYGAGATCFEGTAPLASLSGTTAAVRNDGGCIDSNNTTADFTIAAPAPRNSASPRRLCPIGDRPVLSIEQGTYDAADEGDQDFRTGGRVQVKLDRPAGPSGVTFRVTSRDGTATAGVDYRRFEYRGTFTGGSNENPVMEMVPHTLGDTLVEADETIIMQVSDVSGATVGRSEGVITIFDDDAARTPIHDIQGNGARSPLVGQLVTTTGVITWVKNDGFFLQASDAEADADPATSEGIYVRTGTPFDRRELGAFKRVTGTVNEYVPANDPLQASLTEISGSPKVLYQGYGIPVPAPQILSELGPDPAKSLERLEGMRVTLGNISVVGASHGASDEANGYFDASRFHVVLGANAPRTFREPGVDASIALPLGSPAAIPRSDGNPEVLGVDAKALVPLGSTTLQVRTGAQLSGLTGVMDYQMHRPTLLLDVLSRIQYGATGIPQTNAFQGQTLHPDAVLIGSYNLQRYFDDIDDPSVADTVATTTTYIKRRGKVVNGVIVSMGLPDIVGLIEVEKLSMLEWLAERINFDAVDRWNRPNPHYVARLLPGNSSNGLSMGYLIKTAEVAPGVPRVEVRDTIQIGKDTRWLAPDGSDELLNDYPAFALDAVVHYADGRRFPISTVLVRQAGADGIEFDTADAARLRLKRQRQAEFLATYLNQRQHDEPDTRLMVLGDFNAPQFNDGYADVVNVVAGTPSADTTTVVPGDGTDLVEPNFVNLVDLLEPKERYSVVRRGEAQSLDHVLVNEALIVATSDAKLSFGRINADTPYLFRNNYDYPAGLSDHDPVVAAVVPREAADLGVSVNATAASAQIGQNFGYSVVATNHGPGRADAVGVGFAVDAAVPSLSVTAPSADWTCDAAQIADGKTSIACAIARLDANVGASFGVSASAGAELAGKTVKLAVAANSQSQDVRSDNDTAVASVAILPPPGPDATPIVNGQSLLASGAANEARVYRIEVPAGARNLRIVTTGGSGDIGLYAKRAGAATVSDYDQRSLRSGNSEVILIGAPQAGTWYITVLGGANAFANVSLRPSFVP